MTVKARLPRDVFIIFGGDPSDDKETYKRYVGQWPYTGTPIPGEDVIRFREVIEAPVINTVSDRDGALQKFYADHMNKTIGGTGNIFLAGWDARDEEVRRLEKDGFEAAHGWQKCIHDCEDLQAENKRLSSNIASKDQEIAQHIGQIKRLREASGWIHVITALVTSTKQLMRCSHYWGPMRTLSQKPPHTTLSATS